jgi:hypothetical protein
MLRHSARLAMLIASSAAYAPVARAAGDWARSHAFLDYGQRLGGHDRSAGIGYDAVLPSGLGVGGEFFYLFANTLPAKLSDLPPPANSHPAGEDTTAEYGVLARLSAPLGAWLRIAGGIGYSGRDAVTVAQSNTNGAYYTEARKTQYFLDATGEVEVLAGPVWMEAGFGVRRGIVVGIGTSW